MKKYILLITTLFSIQLYAQPGQFDPSFGVAGVALGPFTSQSNISYKIIQQSDGKLVATGFQVVNLNENMFIVRYKPDGNFDGSFGIGGIVDDSVGNANDFAFAIAQQTDGKFVVAGSFEVSVFRDIFIKRYDTTGTVDTGFGTAGITTVDFQNGSDEIAVDIKIQSDRKILVCGTSFNGNDNDIMLMRFNDDGTLDSTFGIGGKVSTDLNSTDQFGRSLALMNDGRIIVAGSTEDLSTDFDVLIARYLPNGTPDSSFNSIGIFKMDITGFSDEGNSVALQIDDKIVVGGLTTDINGAEDDLLIRLDSTGVPDTSFNSNGIVIEDFNGEDNMINNVLIQTDGGIVTAGHILINGFFDISIARYLSNGSLDNSFGNNGQISHNIALEDDEVYSAILQSDKKIVVTGYYTDSGLSNIYTARFMNDSLSTDIPQPLRGEIKIYPQPAQSMLRIADPHPNSIVYVSDLNGRLLIREKLQSNILDVSSLESGMYLLQIVSTDGTEVVRKFIKQ